MKKLQLSLGLFATVDEQDFDDLAQFKWCASEKRNGFVAVRRLVKEGGKVTQEIMHRRILGAKLGDIVDHINHDSLDNRRKNLRLVTYAQNAFNSRKQTNNTSGFKGVWFDKVLGKYRACISPNNKTKHLGSYATAKEAAQAYNEAAQLFYGEYAYLNKI